jgi:hypothetical protein
MTLLPRKALLLLFLVGLPLIATLYVGAEGGVSSLGQKILGGYFVALGGLRLVMLAVNPAERALALVFGGRLCQATSMVAMGCLLFIKALGASGTTTLLAWVFALGVVAGFIADKYDRARGLRANP